MERATIDGLALDYEVHGTGEPVMLLHCGFVADSWAPLIGETDLGERFQLIAYHRRGYGRSTRPTDPVSEAIPGWFDRAVEAADGVFQAELPSLQSWSFSRDAAAGFTGPVLSVYHDDPHWAGFQEGHEVLLSWFPQTETFVVPVTSHLLHIMNPSAVADGLGAFLRHHAMNVR